MRVCSTSPRFCLLDTFSSRIINVLNIVCAIMQTLKHHFTPCSATLMELFALTPNVKKFFSSVFLTTLREDGAWGPNQSFTH